MLGRPTTNDQIKAQRVTEWINARSPYAVCSAFAGLFALVDSITLVIGVVAGIAAIALGVAGLRDLRSRTHLQGTRLCYTGMTLGVSAIALSTVVWWLLNTATPTGQ